MLPVGMLGFFDVANLSLRSVCGVRCYAMYLPYDPAPSLAASGGRGGAVVKGAH